VVFGWFPLADGAAFEGEEGEGCEVWAAVVVEDGYALVSSGELVVLPFLGLGPALAVYRERLGGLGWYS
jgi:hypothetical protein